MGHSVGGLRPTLGIHVCDQASVIIKQNVVFYNHHTKMGPFSTHVWYHGTHAKEKYVAKDVWWEIWCMNAMPKEPAMVTITFARAVWHLIFITIKRRIKFFDIFWLMVNGFSYLCLIYTGDCEWSAWETGKCSTSCGTGIQEKRRYRLNEMGERCGMDEEVVAKPCINSVCPRIGNLWACCSFQNIIWFGKP